MATPSLTLALYVLLTSSVASFLVLWLLSIFKPVRDKAAEASEPVPPVSNTFLLHGERLVDHDVPKMPTHLQDIETLQDWTDVRAWLGLRFDDLPQTLKDHPDGETTYSDKIDELSPLNLSITKTDSVTRVLITAETAPSLAEWHCASQSAYMQQGAKGTLDHVTFPIWKTDAAGKVIWRNSALAKIVNKLGKMPDLIPASRGSNASPRFSVPGLDRKQPSWFEVDTQKITPDEKLCVATGIDQVVRAETAQRDFVQTLTKTFANLTTGLAVFDKNRQLALFNPALVDLTGISVSFLSARPDVIRFFDELRERQVLPEPKNYANLRTHIREVIAKANEGNYLETWNLPGGITYRVTGRPHPDGAVAFLFEDISAEVLKTRQFRTQIDLSQSVIDGLDEAIVVLAPNDLILLCNTSCSELLKIDPGSSFADMSVQDMLSACRDQFQSDALWSIFESCVADVPAHANCKDRFLNMRNGERLQYRMTVLPGGSRMIGFSKTNVVTSPAPLSVAE